MVAVLLPGAFYALKETRKPPIDLLRRYGVPMAVATDCNPGTSPVLSPTLMLSMACTLFGLTPEEALAGMTVHAAKALGLEKEIGTISTGKAADLCVWRVSRPAELCLLDRPAGAGAADRRGAGCVGSSSRRKPGPRVEQAWRVIPEVPAFAGMT